MAYSEQSAQLINVFLHTLESVEHVYQRDSFSYLAVERNNEFVLLQGTLYLNSTAPTLPQSKFASARVRAGHFLLADAAKSRREFIEQIGTGKLETPHGEFLFPPNSSGNHGARLHPFHEDGLKAQRRLSLLSVLGAETSSFLEANQPDLDWEVRGSETPYDGILELLHEYQPGALQGVNRIDIAALDVVAIDPASIIEGEYATIIVRAIKTGRVEKISVGFRILDQGRVIQRAKLTSDQIKWESQDDVLVGAAVIPVPRAAVVHAIAQYDGQVYHHYFFGDPTSFQNARRAAYEAFDPNLEFFRDVLIRATGAKPEARDFEAAIPWLFWMLGFAPAYVGGPSRMREAPDLLVSTPSGNIAVVECTVGLLKDDSKLQRLHDRTEAVRRNLIASSARYVRVLPVIVTAKTTSEIRPDLEQAEKLGIFVIARELIEELLDRTLITQNADQHFEQAEQETAEAKAKYESFAR